LDSNFSEAAQSEVALNANSLGAAATAIEYVHTGDRRQESYPKADPGEVVVMADLWGIEDLAEVAEAWAIA